eukprot:716797-Hanusia_phi.AAC.1
MTLRCRVSDIAGGGLQPYPPGGEYIAKADETPTKIAKMFGVDPFRLVKLNQGRYPDLISTSKLRSNTLITLPQKDWRCEYKLLAAVCSADEHAKMDADKSVEQDKERQEEEGWEADQVYTVQDIEPDAHAPDHFTIFEGVESKRVQEYPQLNNNYEPGEGSLALHVRSDRHRPQERLSARCILLFPSKSNLGGCLPSCDLAVLLSSLCWLLDLVVIAMFSRFLVLIVFFSNWFHHLTSFIVKFLLDVFRFNYVLCNMFCVMISVSVSISNSVSNSKHHLHLQHQHQHPHQLIMTVVVGTTRTGSLCSIPVSIASYYQLFTLLSSAIFLNYVKDSKPPRAILKFENDQ